MRRLLILACSQKKTTGRGDLPAIERYDGPAFRVLRRYLRERADKDLTVLILSAEYGLIESARAIPHYDRRMSASRAGELRQDVLAAAGAVFRSARWEGIAVCAGKDYRLALDGLLAITPRGTRVNFLGGGLGQRLTNLAAWLRGPERHEFGAALG
jgi:hypothetical protein